VEVSKFKAEVKEAAASVMFEDALRLSEPEASKEFNMAE
jgi:hypothetical protein